MTIRFSLIRTIGRNKTILLPNYALYHRKLLCVVLGMMTVVGEGVGELPVRTCRYRPRKGIFEKPYIEREFWGFSSSSSYIFASARVSCHCCD